MQKAFLQSRNATSHVPKAIHWSLLVNHRFCAMQNWLCGKRNKRNQCNYLKVLPADI
ncbi:hypothetical protein ACE6H2_010249 [Prunus campanulata]